MTQTQKKSWYIEIWQKTLKLYDDNDTILDKVKPSQIINPELCVVGTRRAKLGRMREDLVCIDERSKERDRKRQKMKQEERLGLRESQHARLGHSAVTRVGKIVLNQMPSLKVTLHRSLLRSLSPPAFFFSSFAPPPRPFFNPLPLSFSLLNHVFHPSFFSCSLDIDPCSPPSHRLSAAYSSRLCAVLL